MLIPPSLLMIIYGVLAEVSIGRLFIAGIIPGLIMASAFMLMIWLMARFRPHLVQSETGMTAPYRRKRPAAWRRNRYRSLPSSCSC